MARWRSCLFGTTAASSAGVRTFFEGLSATREMRDGIRQFSVEQSVDDGVGLDLGPVASWLVDSEVHLAVTQTQNS